MEKQLLADVMRELSASAQYRKAKSEMMKLHRSFSNQTFVYITRPNDQTIQMLKDQGFIVEQTPIKEYVQYKVSW